MLYEDFLDAMSNAFRIYNSEATGLIFSLFVVVAITLAIAFATKDNKYSSIISGFSAFLSLAFFTALGWIAPFFIIISVFVVAGFYAVLVRGVLNNE